jgi:MoaA/NifB/PqqE/SkfB family radical SAM enzyme
MHPKPKEASFSEISKNLGKIKEMGVEDLKLSGGEPLLSEKLPDILKKARSLNFNITLTTNAILYPEKSKDLKGLIDKLIFSMDYPFAEGHDRSRGVECFSSLFESIKIAKELNENVFLLFTLTRDSIRFLPEAVDFSERHKIFLQINPVYDFIGTQGFEKNTLNYIKYYFKREYILINLAVLEFLKSGGNNTLFPRCRAVDTVVTMMPDGSFVLPCFFNPTHKIFIEDYEKHLETAKREQGKRSNCLGCTRWPYMVPSFKNKFDRYLIWDLISAWAERRKVK